MKTKILLCAGLLTMGATIPLDSNRVMAKGLAQSEQTAQKNALVSERNAAYYKRSGDVKFDRGDYQDAITDYTRAIELNPNLDKAYFNRGYSKFNLENYGAAIADFTRAVEINPNYSAARENINIARQRQQQGTLDHINRVNNARTCCR